MKKRDKYALIFSISFWVLVIFGIYASLSTETQWTPFRIIMGIIGISAGIGVMYGHIKKGA